jgi:hypothetical protein
MSTTQRILTSSVSSLEDLMGMLFACDVKIADFSSPIAFEEIGSVAIYSDSLKVPRAAIISDFAFANASSAALTMFPPNTIKEAIQSCRLEPQLVDNLKEVMNILVNVFSSPEIDIRLDVLHIAPSLDQIPTSSLQDQCYLVEIPRYQKGRVMIRSL